MLYYSTWYIFYSRMYYSLRASVLKKKKKEVAYTTGSKAHLRRYFQHTHFIPIVGVEKKDAYQLVHGDLPRQHSFGTNLRFTGPVPADSRQ